ncbi:MAG: hypothetical protein A3D95_04500 [Betaproteobacteria bacterium RIFCSPHIGHO2_12_FULL_69_13]|nr:MAG: hypothetical protein A3D95_04500 [Betaproteobacteria bacterium RIFCSPHIGHO2_12_FULL_69_13]OGA66405.1 MAG: hypothetical protein A3G83_18070 [Betaproteobacteria bacterium RIFCSPLOWO2_12_FULL_68_20]
MGGRLLPLSLPELFAHSLALEREAASRFGELARHLRELGAKRIAGEFEDLEKEELDQCEALKFVTRSCTLPELSPWEYSWHFMASAVAIEVAFPRVPEGARDTVALALAAERRTEAFYGEVAERANDSAVRAFAAGMAADEHRHVERLERLLEREPRRMSDADAVWEGEGGRPAA